MKMELNQLWDITTAIIKIILAIVTGKLFIHILGIGENKDYKTLIVMALLLPALLMILILEIYELYFFEYFIICALSLVTGILIGRRSLKEKGMPVSILLLLTMIGVFFGLGYYGLAVAGIISGWITFFKYGKEIEKT